MTLPSLRVGLTGLRDSAAAAIVASVLVAGCDPRIVERTGAAVRVTVPAGASHQDAQRLADAECAKQGLRATYRSTFRRQFTYDCTAPRPP